MGLQRPASSHEGPGAGCGHGVQPRAPCERPPSLQVLRSLNKTYQNLKRKPVAVDLDPKAVTCDELFGIINPATREWKDGNRAGSPQGQGDQWPEQASWAWVHDGLILLWLLCRAPCSERVAGPPRETFSSPVGGGACTCTRGILVALMESREITEGSQLTPPGGGSWGSLGHVSISTVALSGANTPWSPGRGRARKHRPEPRGLGTVFPWGRALMRSVLYKKNPGHCIKDK